MLTFRTATNADIPFLIEGILASEKSGTDILSYSKIFSISEAEVSELIANIFDEEIEGQEWYIPHFWIASENGTNAACLSSWVEGETGLASGILKAQALSFFLGSAWQNASSALQTVSKIQIQRLHGVLQLENIYTVPVCRGKGIAGKLIQHALEQCKSTHPSVQLAEIQLMGNNTAAVHSYTKCGFLQRAFSAKADDTILNLLPGNFRVSLTKTI